MLQQERLRKEEIFFRFKNSRPALTKFHPLRFPVTGRYRISVTKNLRDSHSRSLYVVNEVALGMALAISKESNRGTLTFRGPCIVSIFLLIYFQRDATLHSSFISGKLLYMFRVVSPPIIRSTYSCIYSIWYLLTVTATFLYCGRVGAGLSVVWELYRSV